MGRLCNSDESNLSSIPIFHCRVPFQNCLTDFHSNRVKIPLQFSKVGREISWKIKLMKRGFYLTSPIYFLLVTVFSTDAWFPVVKSRLGRYLIPVHCHQVCLRLQLSNFSCDFFAEFFRTKTLTGWGQGRFINSYWVHLATSFYD